MWIILLEMELAEPNDDAIEQLEVKITGQM